jgi:single-strand DNA-binding protein
MNVSLLCGNLTKDPIMRKTQDGKSVTGFTLAVGQDKNVYYAECEAWEARAEAIATYVKVGDQLMVRGHLRTHVYEDKDGNKRYSTRVVVDEFTFGKKSLANQEKQASQAPKASQAAPKSEPEPSFDIGADVDISSDDLPF